MLRGRVIGLGAAVSVVLLGAWLYASPYIAVYEMRKAVQANDSVGISDYVNFPALRESIKAILVARMTKTMTTSQDNPFAALGAAFASVMVNALIDNLVTPEGIAALMQGQPPAMSNKTPNQSARDKSEVALSKSNQKKTESQMPPVKEAEWPATMGYEGWSRFVVKVANKQDPKETFGLVFLRDGFTWKLSALRMSSNADSFPARASGQAPARGGTDGSKGSEAQTTDDAKCLKLGKFGSTVLSENNVYVEIAWKADITNSCAKPLTVDVVFAFQDSDEYVLDSSSQRLFVAANDIGKARGKMLVAPPSKAARIKTNSVKYQLLR